MTRFFAFPIAIGVGILALGLWGLLLGLLFSAFWFPALWIFNLIARVLT